MLRSLRSCLLLLVVAAPAAGEPIRFARTPDISPDGKLVAFSYLGDIHTVEAAGGTARAVTSHAAHDLNPVFSPDGQSLAFSSNRHGSYDVFVVSVRGGRPRRLTFDSAADMACGWTPDSKQVLFASSRSAAFPSSYELYLVPAAGGRERRVVTEGKEGGFSPAGDRLAYVRGPGSWYRKGYRGSSNDDLWLCNADGSNHRRVTGFNGQDHSPMWSADGETLYYVSEQFGLANLVRLPLSQAGAAARPTAVTRHSDDGVRRARISRGGEWIVYEHGADLWVVSTRDGEKPRQLAIEVHADDKVNNERVVTHTRGATEFALSPDEKHVVFAVQGKLFRQKVGGDSRVQQLTFGPSNDHGAAWSPDGKRLLFLSDRDGHEDIYLLEADDADHPAFTDAHRFKVTRQTSTREAEMGVSFSPDGKRVAFIRGGKLWTMNPDGKDARVLVEEVQVFDYEWSPDSRWVVFARRDGSFASELYVVPSTGATATHPVRNITRYATSNSGVTWSADGRKLAFLSDRRGAANLHVMDLEKPAAIPGGSTPPRLPPPPPGMGWGSRPPLPIDWDDLHLRVQPVMRGAVASAAISPDGGKVAFRDASNHDLWIASTGGGQLTRLTTGAVGPRQMTWSRRQGMPGSSLEVLYFLDGQGNIRLCNTGASSATPATLPFKIKMTVQQDELFTEMFDQSWRFLAENFYDTGYHGRDWDAVRRRYRPLVRHIGLKEDLYALLYLMMGELNASHLGVQGPTATPEEDTAEPGLIFDESYRGKGLKVREVVKRGAADRKGLDLRPGDVVTAIDGVELTDAVNVSRLLNGKVGEAVVLQVTANPADPKVKPRRVEVTGMNRYRTAGQKSPSLAELLYDRWVAGNAARVAELSGGKLGYIHLPSMDDDGLDRFVRALYSDNFDKEAIVLDVRFNGGGFTHDQVLNYLGSKEHTVFRNRDGGQGLVLRSGDRKWHRPLVLLINNRSYSDAEIFPNAFRTLGLGKLVGEPTGGCVIGTTGVQLIDGSQFRLPRIGVFTSRGVNMEKEGVQPDVLVENHPDQLARGLDAQLDRAVEVLKCDVAAWKAKQTARTASR